MSPATTKRQPQRVGMRRVKEANERAEGCWFSPGAQRFFSSRVARLGYCSLAAPGLVFFVSSERYDEETPRFYSVRFAVPCGYDSLGREDRCKIGTVGDFQGYATGRQADKEARRLASITDPEQLPKGCQP